MAITGENKQKKKQTDGSFYNNNNNLLQVNKDLIIVSSYFTLTCKAKLYQ